MGAKTWMLVVADDDAKARLASSPKLDRAATAAAAAALFAKEKLTPLADGCLTWTCPPDDELHIGCFAGLEVIAAREFGIDRPSKLAPRFLAHAGARTVVLHAMHSVVDWFAFGLWREGTLVRALSVAPDNGVIEDLGARLPFELPFWQGQHPAVEPEDDDPDSPYPLPFHPLDLGEAALREFFGYQLEGALDASLLDSDAVALMKFKRRKPFLGLW